MGEILTHAGPLLEGRRRLGAHARGLRLVGEALVDVVAHAPDIRPHVAPAVAERVLGLLPQLHVQRHIVGARQELREELAFGARLELGVLDNGDGRAADVRRRLDF